MSDYGEHLYVSPLPPFSPSFCALSTSVIYLPLEAEAFSHGCSELELLGFRTSMQATRIQAYTRTHLHIRSTEPTH